MHVYFASSSFVSRRNRIIRTLSFAFLSEQLVTVLNCFIADSTPRAYITSHLMNKRHFRSGAIRKRQGEAGLFFKSASMVPFSFTRGPGASIRKDLVTYHVNFGWVTRSSIDLVPQGAKNS